MNNLSAADRVYHFIVKCMNLVFDHLILTVHGYVYGSCCKYRKQQRKNHCTRSDDVSLDGEFSVDVAVSLDVEFSLEDEFSGGTWRIII